MFAASSDAFLRIRGPGIARRPCARPFGNVSGPIAQEDGHKLVHAGIGEQQSRRVRQERSRRNDRVAVLGEEIEEGLADLGGSHEKWEGRAKGTQSKRQSFFPCTRTKATGSRRGIQDDAALVLANQRLGSRWRENHVTGTTADSGPPWLGWSL